LVQSARNVFQVNSSIPPGLDADAAKAYAYRLVQEDATYCQPAGAQLLNSQAILTAQPVVMSAPPVAAAPTALAPPPLEPSIRRSTRGVRRGAVRVPEPVPQVRAKTFFEEHPPSFRFDTNVNPVPPRIGIVR
jgi:hypothetical protein